LSLADDLLRQAYHLAQVDRRRPAQANLRRAISSAYYSVFHELSMAGASLAARGSGRSQHQTLVRRSFQHGRMADVCRSFGRQTDWTRLAGAEPSAALGEVADSFVLLQQNRHDADYDLDTSFTRAETKALIELADVTISSWRRIRRSPEAEYLLLAMLVGPPRR
jgi:uncharacterized protein (UPF0332 family)